MAIRGTAMVGIEEALSRIICKYSSVTLLAFHEQNYQVGSFGVQIVQTCYQDVEAGLSSSERFNSH